MGYRFRLEKYEGPIDLLLHLIEESKIDIYDIPISSIASQYMEYLAAMPSLDLEVTSEFLVMAATLVQIKSRMLLPKPSKTDNTGDSDAEGEEDPRQELVDMLLEYKHYKQAAQVLEQYACQREHVFTRMPTEFTTQELFLPENLILDDLIKAFAALFAKTEQTFKVVERDRVTVKDKMRQILRRLNQAPQGCTFHELLSNFIKSEIVITFLAVLELIKLRRIAIEQRERFGEIMITKIIEPT